MAMWALEVKKCVVPGVLVFVLGLNSFITVQGNRLETHIKQLRSLKLCLQSTILSVNDLVQFIIHVSGN